jgi:hypothetical protein
MSVWCEAKWAANRRHGHHQCAPHVTTNFANCPKVILELQRRIDQVGTWLEINSVVLDHTGLMLRPRGLPWSYLAFVPAERGYG